MFTNFSDTIVRTAVGILGTTVCAGLCLMGAAAPATATPVGDLPSVAVSYAGLDLTSAADRAELDHRILRTARKICTRTNAGSRDLVSTAACVHSAIDGARAQVSVKRAKAGA